MWDGSSQYCCLAFHPTFLWTVFKLPVDTPTAFVMGWWTVTTLATRWRAITVPRVRFTVELAPLALTSISVATASLTAPTGATKEAVVSYIITYIWFLSFQFDFSCLLAFDEIMRSTYFSAVFFPTIPYWSLLNEVALSLFFPRELLTRFFWIIFNLKFVIRRTIKIKMPTTTVCVLIRSFLKKYETSVMVMARVSLSPFWAKPTNNSSYPHFGWFFFLMNSDSCAGHGGG